MLARSFVDWRHPVTSRFTAKRFQTTVPLPGFKYHLIDESKAIDLQYPLAKEEALKLYRDMSSIRRMETTLADWYQRRLVRGFCHLYSGQEAIASGLFHQMRPEDTVITSYRAHGYVYLLGGRNPEPVMAELMGVAAGCSKGKGGSMHVYAPKMYGGNGIVGAQIPIGTGLGLAARYGNTKGISFTIYGDGAANQGQVFESYNMAKLWNLPVIYVIENNKYAMGTSSDRGSANPEYYRTCVYIPGVQVDGMDVLSVSKAVEYAINHVTEGKGPIVLEMVTYRYFGHSMSDPGKSYRTREEIKAVRDNSDPITQFEAKLTKGNIVTEDDIKAVKKEVKTAFADLEKKLTSVGPVKVEEVAADIQKNQLVEDIRGVSLWKGFKHVNLKPPQ